MNYRLGSRKTTEFLLLTKCCRWNFAGGHGEEIQELAGEADWTRFLALARRHRVQGLAQRCLRELPVALPMDVTASLAEDSAAIAEHNLRAARQSALLFEAFTAGAIPLIFIKGLTLSKLVYGDPFVKMSHDIDVLVPSDAIADSAAALNKLGYRRTVPPAAPQSGDLQRWHERRKESVWRSPDGLHLELHSRLADSPRLIPAIGIGSPRQEVEIASGILLPTLAADDLFAYLCVHGASSAWFRLKWITDLAALLEGSSEAQISRLFRRSQELGAGRSCAQALLLASRIYGTSIDRSLAARLAASPVNRWLGSAAAAALAREREPTETRLGTMMIHLTQFFLRPGLRFKIEELGRQIADAVRNHL